MKNRMVFFLFLILAVMAVSAALGLYVYGWPGYIRRENGHSFSEEEAAREILFDGDRIFTTKDSFVQVNEQTVTITRGGVYMLRGNLDDGQIIIDVGKEDKVKLKLNDLSVTCSYGPPIYVKSAKKLSLRLKKGSENRLEDMEPGKGNDPGAGSEDRKDKSGEEYPAQVKNDSWRACIYARSDLQIKGEGSLVVNGRHRHGIFSSQDLKIKSGTIKVEAARQALHGKKSVLIEDGTIFLKAGTDGIHSNGTLDIKGGSLKIDAGKYGLYAFSRLYVDRTPDSGVSIVVTHALSEAGCQGRLEY